MMNSDEAWEDEITSFCIVEFNTELNCWGEKTCHTKKNARL